MKDRQYNDQKIPKWKSEAVINERQSIQWPKDTKGEIRSRKSMKDRQYNDQKIPKGKSEA
jgi:hypothetical protein